MRLSRNNNPRDLLMIMRFSLNKYKMMILIFERKFEKSNLDSKNRIGNEGGAMPQIRGTHKLVLFFKNR